MKGDGNVAQLTVRQEQYLLMLRTSKGLDRTLAGVADYFEVSRPSAFHIIENLIKENMVERKEDKEIAITPEGIEYIQRKYEGWIFFSKWMQGGLGMVPLQAEKEARKLVTSLENDTIVAIIKNIQEVSLQKKRIQMESFDGEAVKFSVYKKDVDTLSMGDKGFMKPARIQEFDGVTYLILRINKVEYQSKKNAILHGELSHLWYQYKKRWHEVEIDKEGFCYIPIAACNRECGKETITIRARSSVGIFKMPEGEARIVFHSVG